MSTPVTKDRLMFAIGAAGFLHELVLRSAERPFLLALCGALMGLPFVLSADSNIRLRRSQRDDEDDDHRERWSHL